MRLYMTNDGDVYLLLTTGRDCYSIEEMAVYRPLEDTGDSTWYIEPLVDFLHGLCAVSVDNLSSNQLSAFTTIQDEMNPLVQALPLGLRGY